MPPMQRHAVHRRRHAVLADAVVDEAAAVVARPTSPSCALVRVLLEPVRSAEPPIISGTAGGDDFEREFATRCGSRSPSASAASFSFTRAHRGVERAAAARRACGARTRRACRRRAPRAACPRPCARPCARWPAARQCVAHVGGNLERRRRSSRASRARPRSPRRRAASRAPSRLPALVGAPKPMVVLQAISVGRSDVLRLLDRGRDRLRIVAVDARARPSRRPRSASPDRPSRRATAARRSRCRCRRTARSAC